MTSREPDEPAPPLPDATALEARFVGLVARLRDASRPLAVDPRAIFRELLARYDEPHRRYHSRRHLAFCVREVDAAHAELARPDEAEFALFYHDAIYEPRPFARNEAESADLARRVLASIGAPEATAARVAALILATASHDVPTSLAGAEAADAAWVLDIDMGILGAGPRAYAVYEAGVRAEYGWVPEFSFRRSRGDFLKGVLAKPVVFLTPRYRERLEARARDNLARAVRAAGARRAPRGVGFDAEGVFTTRRARMHACLSFFDIARVERAGRGRTRVRVVAARGAPHAGSLEFSADDEGAAEVLAKLADLGHAL